MMGLLTIVSKRVPFGTIALSLTTPILIPSRSVDKARRSYIRRTRNAKHIDIGPTQAHSRDHMTKPIRRRQRRLPWMAILSVKITCGNT